MTQFKKENLNTKMLFKAAKIVGGGGKDFVERVQGTFEKSGEGAPVSEHDD